MSTIYNTTIFCSLMLLCACGKKQEVNRLSDVIINQHWQFRQADSTGWMNATVPGCVHTDLLANHKIEDPFYRTNEKTVQWIDKKDWEYKTTFYVDHETFARNTIELQFDGLDTYADVFVNDSAVLKTDNMFRTWKANLKNRVKEGENTLHILFHSPVNIGLQKLKALGYALPAVNDQSENGGLGDQKVSIFTRKAGYHYGWDWGPRLVTSGIWRPVHLIAWNNARIDDMQIIQDSLSAKSATLTAVFEILSTVHTSAQLILSSPTEAAVTAHKNIHLHQGINKVAISFSFPNPNLWWTNGLGEAFLYQITGKLVMKHTLIDQKETSVGLRTVKIIQKPDSLGKSFYVELNGVPVFMKGANYIPCDNFLPRVTHGTYEKIIQSAVDTHMNMLRVWGGGIYEDDYFYNLADRSGILLWHDLMFACSMYPGDEAFLENVRQEVIQNVKRLRNHPSIALWCGNNEIDVAWQQDNEQGGWGWKQKFTPEQRQYVWHSYDTLFHKIIPAIISGYDPQRFYWPSSPLADWYKQSDFSAHSGDTHYWDVWWGQVPFEAYNTHIGRFMSEYGFQSFPEFNSVKLYTQPGDWDIFSDVMQAHQRSSIGNGTIKNYMKLYYKVPADFKKFLYVGQVLQAEGIKVAMEAHRRNRAVCMGSLFWQINDCWPVASWSSTDYYRRWKAQQYFAKQAFDQVLVSPVLEHGNITVYIVNDGLTARSMMLELKVLDFSGKVIAEINLPVTVKPNGSEVYFKGELKQMLHDNPSGKALLTTTVLENHRVIARNILYFLPVKELTLSVPKINKTLQLENGEFVLELSSDKLVKNLYLSLSQGNGFFSDNYFDMLPGEKVTVHYKPEDNPLTLEEFQKELQLMQMAEIY